MLITSGGAIVSAIGVAEDLVAAGVAESETVRTTEKAPFAVGIPETMPVPEAIDKPPGRPAADQL